MTSPKLHTTCRSQQLSKPARVWSDGTAAMVFSPAELVARLAALVPPPNKNQVLYHGVLAPNAALRSRVVPKPTAEPEAERCSLVRPDRRARGRRRWRTWSSLLLRVFGVEGWLCPHCDELKVLRTVVIGPPATLTVIRGLGQSARGSPARSGAAPRAVEPPCRGHGEVRPRALWDDISVGFGSFSEARGPISQPLQACLDSFLTIRAVRGRLRQPRWRFMLPIPRSTRRCSVYITDR